MANILISFFSSTSEDKLLIFYESFMRSLEENGNNVKYIVTNDFLNYAWNGDNILKDNINSKALEDEINKFQPELCFAFNNSIPSKITQILECPILLWHSDVFEYFNAKKEIKNNPNRYYYICPFDNDIVTIKKELLVKENQILNIIPATGIKKEEKKVAQNISFIGSMFHAGDIQGKLRHISNPDRLDAVLKRINNDSSIDYKKILEEENCSYISSFVTREDCLAISSVQSRNHTLSMLTDLGLKIFGKGEYFNWLDIATILPAVAMCYKNKNVFSLKHNQDIYNSSKISINISHAQAQDGFPWRVFDILASNSCLISDKKDGLIDFCKGYVDIPMYENPYEARKLCKKLLKDDSLRRDIVNASQKCINDKGRWVHRFRDIQDVIGITLVNIQNSVGNISQLKSLDFIKSN